MGRKEEQRGKFIPGTAKELSLMLKLVLKAQNGMNAELQLDVKWGGWLTWVESSSENDKSIIRLSVIYLMSYQIVLTSCVH